MEKFSKRPSIINFKLDLTGMKENVPMLGYHNIVAISALKNLQLI